MIVKLGDWSKHPLVELVCDGLSQVEGAVKKTTPQRCFIKLGDETLASLGVEKSKAVVEFKTGSDHYAAAHGSRFVRPHPLRAMALDGWLQARMSNREEAEQVLSWILASLEERGSG